MQAYLVLLGFALVRFTDVAFFAHRGKALGQQKGDDCRYYGSPFIAVPASAGTEPATSPTYACGAYAGDWKGLHWGR